MTIKHDPASKAYWGRRTAHTVTDERDTYMRETRTATHTVTQITQWHERDGHTWTSGGAFVETNKPRDNTRLTGAIDTRNMTNVELAALRRPYMPDMSPAIPMDTSGPFTARRIRRGKARGAGRITAKPFNAPGDGSNTHTAREDTRKASKPGKARMVRDPFYHPKAR